MSKHTPGPWAMIPTENSNGFRITDENNMPLVEILDSPGMSGLFKDERDNWEAKANAKLIASAPELLEACVLARKLMLKQGVTVDNADQYNLLDNAIKKATQ